MARGVYLTLTFFFALSAFCLAQEPPAVPGPNDETWTRWVEQAVTSTREAFAQAANQEFDQRAANAARIDADARRTSYVAVREPALDQEASASSIEQLTAALKTDVEDAEAGVSVAPFLLFGSDEEPHSPLAGLTLFLAALKEGKTRIGAKWAWVSGTEPPASLKAIGLQTCKLDEAALRNDLALLRSHFAAACVVLLTHITERPKDEEEAASWAIARRGCGAESPPPMRLTMARQALKAALDQARQRATAAQLNAMDAIAGSIAWLDFAGEHRLPLATGCYSPEALKIAYRQHEWARPKLNFGLLSTADYFPRKSGFNPGDPKALPKGQNAALLIQGEASLEKRGFSLTSSLGWARSRVKFDEKRYTSLRPALSASFAVARLGGGSLTDNCGQIRLLDDGSLPPMLIAGLLAKLDYAHTRPESQTSKLNSAEYQIFLQFRISEKLSFRLGVPYKGELVARDKSDSLPEKRHIQWSLPVFVATIIKM